MSKSVATITVYAVITRALGFAFRIFLAAQIGAMLLGVYQVAFTFFIVLLGFVASGVPLTVSALTARNPLDCNKSGGICTSAIVISGAATAVTVAAVFLLKTPISHLLADSRSYSVLLMLLPALVFSGLAAPFRGSIWGRKHYTACSVIELVEQIARIGICIVFFFWLDLGLDKARLAALSMSIGCAISGLCYVVSFFRDKYRLSRPAELKPLLSTSTPITVVHVASSAVNLIIALIMPLRLMAGGMNAESAMGLYGESVGMALGFLFVPLTLTGSLSMALVPELADHMHASSCVNVRALCSKGLCFAVIVAGFFIPVFSALGVPIGLFCYGSYRSGLFLSQGALLMIPLALEQIASSMMNSLGLEKKAFFNFSIGTLVLLALLWFLTPKMGVNALIVAMGASYTVSMILHTIVLRERISLQMTYLGVVIKVLLCCIPGTLIAYFAYPLLLEIGVLAAIMISGILAAIFTLGAYLLANVVQITTLKGAIRTRLAKTKIPRARKNA